MVNNKRVIMLEVGVLLNKDHPEYEAYSNVYDKKRGYHDEDRTFYYASKLSEVIEKAEKYVEAGVEGTYAIITDQGMVSVQPEEMTADDAWYNSKYVIYSIAKIDGKVIQIIGDDKEGGKATKTNSIKVTETKEKRITFKNILIFLFSYLFCATGLVFLVYWLLLGDPFEKYTLARAIGAGAGLAVGRLIGWGIEALVKYIRKGK